MSLVDPKVEQTVLKGDKRLQGRNKQCQQHCGTQLSRWHVRSRALCSQRIHAHPLSSKYTLVRLLHVLSPSGPLKRFERNDR